MVRLFVLALAICGLSCQGEGEESDPDLSQSPSSIRPRPQVVEEPLKDLRGRIFIDSHENPAVGFSVWLIDHAQYQTRMDEIDEQGRFSLPTSFFAEERDYTLHLLDRNERYVTSFDFSQDLQGIYFFRFDGGHGAHIGDVVVSYDGETTQPVASAAFLSGGFYPHSLRRAQFPMDMPKPFGVDAFKMGMQLQVTDSLDLFYGFLLYEQFPKVYRNALRKYSRTYAHVVVQPTNPVVNVGLRARKGRLDGAWLHSDSGPVLWSDRGFQIPKTDEHEFFAAFSNERIPKVRDGFILQAATSRGLVQLPAFLLRVLAMPPLVEQVVSGGSSVVLSDLPRNGYLRPFCVPGSDLTLRVRVPFDSQGETVAITDIEQLTIAFDYFDDDLGGGPMVVDKSSFPERFQRSFSDAELAGSIRRWDADERKLRFMLRRTLDESPAIHDLTLFKELLPASFNDISLRWIRIRISYQLTFGLASSIFFFEVCD